MGFFFIIAGWTALWLFISNLIQLHLMPLIMVGQNLQDRYAELMLEILRRSERMEGARNT